MASSQADPLPLPCLASLGVLSDIQYANEDDGHNFLRTERRFYRHALIAAGRAIERMRGVDSEEWRCDGVLHLGDLIDGFNKTKDSDPARPKSEAALKAIMGVLPPPATSRIVKTRGASGSGDANGELRCYHLIGNHELINFPRSRWARELGLGALSEQSRLEADLRATPATAASEAAAAAATAYLFPTHSIADPLAEQSPSSSDNAASPSDLPVTAAAAPVAEPTVYTSTSPLYYDIVVADRFRLLMLDAFDIGVSGYEDMPATPATASSGDDSAAAAAAAPSADSAAEAAASAKSHVHGHSHGTHSHAHSHTHGHAHHHSRHGHGHRHGHHGRHHHHHHHRDLARAYLARENPNDEKYSPENLEGTEKRKVAFNGGMGSAQLMWVRAVLGDCARQGQHALLVSHVAFHEGASHCSALLWNRQELLDIVAEFSATVVACLHGHDHDGGHCIDPSTGVVHHTFEGLLTSPPDQNTYGRMDFFADRIRVLGVDRMKSFDIPLGKEERKQAATQAAATATAVATSKGLARITLPA